MRTSDHMYQLGVYLLTFYTLKTDSLLAIENLVFGCNNSDSVIKQTCNRSPVLLPGHPDNCHITDRRCLGSFVESQYLSSAPCPRNICQLCNMIKKRTWLTNNVLNQIMENCKERQNSIKPLNCACFPFRIPNTTTIHGLTTTKIRLANEGKASEFPSKENSKPVSSTAFSRDVTTTVQRNISIAENDNPPAQTHHSEHIVASTLAGIILTTLCYSLIVIVFRRKHKNQLIKLANDKEMQKTKRVATTKEDGKAISFESFPFMEDHLNENNQYNDSKKQTNEMTSTKESWCMDNKYDQKDIFPELSPFIKDNKENKIESLCQPTLELKTIGEVKYKNENITNEELSSCVGNTGEYNSFSRLKTRRNSTTESLMDDTDEKESHTESSFLPYSDDD